MNRGGKEQALIAAYQAARIVRNHGIRHEQQPPTPPASAAAK